MKRSIVCPWKPSLIEQFEDRSIVVCTDIPENVVPAASFVRKNNRLFAVLLRWNKNLSELPVHCLEENVPLTVWAAGFGNYREFDLIIEPLRKLNCRLFIDTRAADCTQGLKILSSLGLPCGVRFAGGEVDWDALDDLLHHAVYGRVEHAPVQPFAKVVETYDPHAFTRFDMVFFNDPLQFLHISENGDIALTAEQLERGEFIGHGVGDIAAVEQDERYNVRPDLRREHLLRQTACSFCAGFRVCGGTFLESGTDTGGCSTLFTDLCEAADYVREREKDGTTCR